MNLSMDSSEGFWYDVDVWFNGLRNPLFDWYNDVIIVPGREWFVYQETVVMLDAWVIWLLRVLYGLLVLGVPMAIVLAAIYYIGKWIKELIYDYKLQREVKAWRSHTQPVATRPRPTPRVPHKKRDEVQVEPTVVEEIEDEPVPDLVVPTDEPKGAPIASSLKNYLLQVISEDEKNPGSVKGKLQEVLSEESEYYPLLDDELKSMIEGVIEKLDDKLVVESS